MLIFAGLIHNEFIVLNFCGLQNYTKLFLEKKAEEDIRETIFKPDNDDSLKHEIKEMKMIDIFNTDYSIEESDLNEE